MSVKHSVSGFPLETSGCYCLFACENACAPREPTRWVLSDKNIISFETLQERLC